MEKVNILLVDDDEEDRLLFSLAIKKTGIESSLTEIESCDELIRHLGECNSRLPDIIFLDINMPLKDGKLCLKEIRKDQKFHNIPVIMYSTSDHPNDVEETFREGANLYTVKAVSFSDQVDILKKIFEGNWKKKLWVIDKSAFFIHS